MKFFITLIIFYTALYSKVYYSKVQPYEVRDISSNVTGVVIFSNENMLGKKLSKNPYIKIDSELDIKELESIKIKLAIYANTITINQEILHNLKKLLDKKQINYKQIENLKIKSRIEKDREFYDLIISQNSHLSTKKEINNLKSQIADLEFRKVQLQKSIRDKNFSHHGFTLYALFVKNGQVVNPSMLVAKIADTSKALLTIFLDEEDVVHAKEKIIYINGKTTSYKVNRLLKIADSTNISKYKAQIIIKAPQTFSQLAQVELKDE